MMRILGYLSLIAVAAIMVMVMASGPAVASPAKGYRVRYVPHSRDFCVTPLIDSEARRLGIAVHRTECHTLAAWAKRGVTIAYA